MKGVQVVTVSTLCGMHSSCLVMIRQSVNSPGPDRSRKSK